MSMLKTPDGQGWISTSDPNRKTLGTQMVEKEKKLSEYSEPQEVGETLTELGKTICKGLEDGINNARKKGIKGLIYIHIVEQPLPPVLGERPVLQLIFFVRRTKPDMEWNTCLYSHDDDDETPTLEWSLPSFQHVRQMLMNPTQYTPDHIKWVKRACKEQGLEIF